MTDYDSSSRKLRPSDVAVPHERGPIMLWVWEGVRYLAAYGGTGLVIAFWYWMFERLGTF